MKAERFTLLFKSSKFKKTPLTPLFCIFLRINELFKTLFPQRRKCSQRFTALPPSLLTISLTIPPTLSFSLHHYSLILLLSFSQPSLSLSPLPTLFYFPPNILLLSFYLSPLTMFPNWLSSPTLVLSSPLLSTLLLSCIFSSLEFFYAWNKVEKISFFSPTLSFYFPRPIKKVKYSAKILT